MLKLVVQKALQVSQASILLARCRKLVSYFNKSCVDNDKFKSTDATVFKDIVQSELLCYETEPPISLDQPLAGSLPINVCIPMWV